jgi:hypothetical protein
MGWFSGKKKIYVSSTTYNLAGDEPPIGYIKTVIASSVIFDNKSDLTGAIQQSLIKGPGMRMRSFLRWAKQGQFNAVLGMTGSQFVDASDVDEAVVAAAIPHTALEVVTVKSAVIAGGDYTYWADAYMYDNHPTEVELEYTVDYDSVSSVMTITLPLQVGQTVPTVYTETLTDFSSDSRYLYAEYTITSEAGVEGPSQFLMYKENGDNLAFEEMFSLSKDGGAFFPYLPIRHNSQFLSPSHNGSIYQQVKKGYKKAIQNGNIDELIDKIADNDSVGDIDHAYIVFGVSLNTKDNSSKRYLYQFFNYLYEEYSGAGSVLRITGKLDYDMRIGWSNIQRYQGFGKFKPDAFAGEYHVTFANSFTYIYHQIDSEYYEFLMIFGLNHENKIYKGKGVGISAQDAINDSEVSGFIIPLHEEIYRATGLVHATQMANANAYIVFNSYEEVKQKWYQTTIFKIILIIVIIVITVFTAGAGGGLAAGGGGVLGTAAAVGAALGFTGAMAILVGTLANAIAAMLIMKIIQAGATALFGEEIGAIVGTIAGIVAIAYGTSYSTGQPMGSMVGELTRADNLLKITASVGNAYADYLKSSAEGIQAKTNEMVQTYEAKVEEINAATAANLGFGGEGVINPMSFTDVFLQAGENRESFLSRTLMTGSELASLSIEMLRNFADLSISTELN